MSMTLAPEMGYCHSSVDSSAPSTLPAQVRVPSFYQFIFELCHVEKTKINKNVPGFALLKKKPFITTQTRMKADNEQIEEERERWKEIEIRIKPWL